eukprot:TRINITY_DN17977_c0_g1_i1.p1 TRINITY_DN17977_c0_g1~~TRINITY_DN17977_c0_g1_i1.p1  ORF type:complete len:113 (-),score=6.28 TRINITY_DN17977_c0_g1_i1:193-531(-)
MRLSQILLVWPKTRPNGYIWNGKHQMVRKVQPWHVNAINKDLAREKRNAHLCLNPYITPEQERVGVEADKLTQPRRDQHTFRLRKEKLERTVMAPTYVEDGFAHMKQNVSWE